MDWIKLKLFLLTFFKKSRLLIVRVVNAGKNTQNIILRQELLAGKTNFVLLINQQIITISAQELYNKTDLMTEFCHKDLITIVSTAVQEQAMDDLVFALKWPHSAHALAMDAADKPRGLG